MNNLAPTYEQFVAYQPAYADEVSAADFEGVVSDATAWVDAYIMPNVVDATTDADVLEAYQRAICAVITTGVDYPSMGVKNYTSGKVHEELDGTAYEMLTSAVAPYLSGTGLLCRWL